MKRLLATEMPRMKDVVFMKKTEPEKSLYDHLSARERSGHQPHTRNTAHYDLMFTRMTLVTKKRFNCVQGRKAETYIMYFRN